MGVGLTAFGKQWINQDGVITSCC